MTLVEFEKIVAWIIDNLADLKYQQYTFFLQIYVACSIHLFSMAKFWPPYDQLARIPSLPYVIPIAQIGLMGSVYCTVALAVERFLAVCYPFLPRK